MSTVVRQRSGDGLRLYCKGASESVLELCNRYITVRSACACRVRAAALGAHRSRDTPAYAQVTGEVKELDDVVRAKINVTINAYASDGTHRVTCACGSAMVTETAWLVHAVRSQLFARSAWRTTTWLVRCWL